MTANSETTDPGAAGRIAGSSAATGGEANEARTNTQPRPADAKTYNTFVASITLDAINVVSIEAERQTAGEATLTRFELVAGYQIENSAIHYRFESTGHLTDETGADYGHVRAAVVVTLALMAPAPPIDCVERFGSQSALMMAHPYLREALATTALRLGFNGVLLPLLIQQPESARI